MAHLDHTTTAAPIGRLTGELLTVTARVDLSGAVVVAVRGEAEMTTCPLLRDRLVAHLRSARHLVLDLGEVSLLCAAGLTVLVVVREAALVAGTRFCVVARTRPVLLPLMLTGLTKVLDLHADVAAALLCPSSTSGIAAG